MPKVVYFLRGLDHPRIDYLDISEHILTDLFHFLITLNYLTVFYDGKIPKAFKLKIFPWYNFNSVHQVWTWELCLSQAEEHVRVRLSPFSVTPIVYDVIVSKKSPKLFYLVTYYAGKMIMHCRTTGWRLNNMVTEISWSLNCVFMVAGFCLAIIVDVAYELLLITILDSLFPEIREYW